MSDPINGQIVPALGQWQGFILIMATLVVSLLIRWRRATSRERRRERYGFL